MKLSSLFLIISLVVVGLAMGPDAFAQSGGVNFTDLSNLTLEKHRTEEGDNESQNPDITDGRGGYPTGFDPYATGADFSCCGTEYGPGNLKDSDVGTNFSYGKYSDGKYATPKAGVMTLEIGRPRLVTGIAIYNGYTDRDDGTYRLLDGWDNLLGAWTVKTPAGAGTNAGADSFWLRLKNPVVTDKLVLETTSSETDGTNSYREIVILHDGPITLHGTPMEEVYTISWPAGSAWQGEPSSTQSPGHLIRKSGDRWLQLNGDRRVMATYDKREQRNFMLLFEGDGHLLEVDFDRNRIQKRHAGGAVRWTRTIHEITKTPDDNEYLNYVPEVKYTAKGGDVTYVSYGDKNALGARRYEGHFEQLPDKSWRHLARPHPASRNLVETERYRETGRDEWSVSLEGTSPSNKGVSVTMNLWLKTVKRGEHQGDLTRASNAPLPTAAELAEQALIARQEEEANYNRTLRSPVSKRDLGKIMNWIGQESATEAVGFCYKNSAPRPSYPWLAGDPALPGGLPTLISRCEADHGSGQCSEDTGVVYPQCRSGFHGVGPICWQSCPTYHDVLATGQNVKLDCGALCATNRDECAKGVNDMVHAPINLVLNILTAGLAGAAQNAAAQTSKQALDASLDAVQLASSWGQAAANTSSAALGGASAIATSATAASTFSNQVARATVGSVLKETFKLGATSLAENISDLANGNVVDILADVAQIAGETNGAFNSLTEAVEGIGGAANAQSLAMIDDIGRWSASYGKNFRHHTSSRIERIIDQNFAELDDRAYIKQKFGHYQLAGMISADGWETAGQVLGVLSVEPTGVISVVAAFAHPVCRDAPTPFPSIQVLPANQRPTFDPMTRAQ